MARTTTRETHGPAKMEIIRLVEQSDLPMRVTLRQLGLPRSTFYGWYQRYGEMGFEGFHDKTPVPRPRWNKIPHAVQDEVLDMALTRTDLPPRELACTAPTRSATSCPNRACTGS